MAAQTSSFESFMQLIGVLLIFIFVLVITYLATRWIASYQRGHSFNKNLQVIETLKITANKYIQIVQLGNRYYSIGVSKEHITFLSALDEEQLDLQESDVTLPNTSFMDVMGRVTSKMKKKVDKK